MKTLPDLIIESKHLAKIIIDSDDVFPHDLDILKEQTEVAIKAKVDSYYSIMQHFEREAEMWERQEQMCKAQRQKFEKINERLKDRLKECMTIGNLDKLEGNYFRFNKTPMRPKMVIAPGAQIPANFQRVVQSVEIDKDALRLAVDQGEIIEGVTLEPVYALRKYP